MKWQTVAINSEKTFSLGALLGALLKGGEVIELEADLGGGKTTFTQGIAGGLGIKQILNSPTFTISRQYHTPSGIGLHHYDFYRLPEPGIVKRELSDSITDGNVVVIEWAKHIRDILPGGSLRVELGYMLGSADERRITFHYPEIWRERILQLQNKWEP